MAAKRKDEWPRTVSFGTGKVRISKRTNGCFALCWREMGETRKTTKGTAEKAIAWAEEKAHELDAGSGRRWVDAGEAEAVEALRGIAGEGDGSLRRLVEDVRGAVKWLDGRAAGADLTAAARWYAEHGPLKIAQAELAAAVARFLAEYDRGSKATRSTFGTELDGFLKVPAHHGLLLSEVTEERLTAWVHRKVDGKHDPAPRTLRGRITTWVTFLNRCRDWKLLPERGKHAAEVLRKPVIPDAGKEILSVEQGKALLVAVREHDSKLETYLLIAGWLGLRPSEVQRLTWQGFDWERGYLHVTAAVAGKTSSERYVPVDPRVLKLLRWQFITSRKKVTANVCGFRSREFLSVLARREKVLATWPPDVLRHSFCSYRIACVKSLDQVAEEAGNSPAILKSNYRKPMRPEDGAAWWGILGKE